MKKAPKKKQEQSEQDVNTPAFIVAVVFLVLAAIAILTTYVKGYAEKQVKLVEERK